MLISHSEAPFQPKNQPRGQDIYGSRSLLPAGTPRPSKQGLSSKSRPVVGVVQGDKGRQFVRHAKNVCQRCIASHHTRIRVRATCSTRRGNAASPSGGYPCSSALTDTTCTRLGQRAAQGLRVHSCLCEIRHGRRALIKQAIGCCEVHASTRYTSLTTSP